MRLRWKANEVYRTDGCWSGEKNIKEVPRPRSAYEFRDYAKQGTGKSPAFFLRDRPSVAFPLLDIISVAREEKTWRRDLVARFVTVCAPTLASTYKFPLYGVLLVARRRNSPDAPRIKNANLFSSPLAGEWRKIFGVITEQRLLGAKNIIVGAVVHAAKAFLYRSFGCVSPVGEKGKVANRFFRFIMTFAPPRKSPQLFPFSCRCVCVYLIHGIPSYKILFSNCSHKNARLLFLSTYKI